MNLPATYFPPPVKAKIESYLWPHSRQIDPLQKLEQTPHYTHHRLIPPVRLTIALQAPTTLSAALSQEVQIAPLEKSALVALVDWNPASLQM